MVVHCQDYCKKHRKWRFYLYYHSPTTYSISTNSCLPISRFTVLSLTWGGYFYCSCQHTAHTKLAVCQETSYLSTYPALKLWRYLRKSPFAMTSTTILHCMVHIHILSKQRVAEPFSTCSYRHILHSRASNPMDSFVFLQKQPSEYGARIWGLEQLHTSRLIDLHYISNFRAHKNE